MSFVANAWSLIRLLILKNSMHKQNNNTHDDDMENIPHYLPFLG